MDRERIERQRGPDATHLLMDLSQRAMLNTLFGNTSWEFREMNYFTLESTKHDTKHLGRKHKLFVGNSKVIVVAVERQRHTCGTWLPLRAAVENHNYPQQMVLNLQGQ